MAFTLIGSFGIAVGCSFLSITKRKIDINRKLKLIKQCKNFRICNTNNLSIKNNKTEKEIFDFVNDKDIEIFAKKLKENVLEEAYDNFMVNLSKIKKVDNKFIKAFFRKMDIEAFVYPKDNGEIYVNFGSNIDKNSKTHELIHLAVTRYDEENKTYYTGFNHQGIGKAINEGYTCLLDERYFNDEDNVEENYMYEFLKFISYLLEIFVGQDKMEKLYCNSDLKGLLTELEKYIGFNRSLELVSKLDDLLENRDVVIKRNSISNTIFHNFIDSENEKLWYKLLNDIIEILLDIKASDLKKKLEDNTTTRDYASNSMHQYWANIRNELNYTIGFLLPDDFYNADIYLDNLEKVFR